MLIFKNHVYLGERREEGVGREEEGREVGVGGVGRGNKVGSGRETTRKQIQGL